MSSPLPNGAAGVSSPKPWLVGNTKLKPPSETRSLSSQLLKNPSLLNCALAVKPSVIVNAIENNIFFIV